MERFTYNTSGTCSRQIVFELEGEIVNSIEFVGGCPGNLIGLSQLIKGRKIEELIDLLHGIECRNGTSCPDQFAKALQVLKDSRQTNVG